MLCCFQPGSPPLSPKGKPRKKNSRTELSPLSAIQEGLLQESGDLSNRTDIEQGVPAEQLDNLVNNLNSDYLDENYLKAELHNLANESEASIVRSKSSEGQRPNGDLRSMSGSVSDSKLLVPDKSSHAKKLACKTVSDPYGTHKTEENHVSFMPPQGRPRSSSDPDPEQIPETEEPPPVQKRKQRKFSVPNFHFPKHKSKHKKSKEKEKLHAASSNSDSEIIDKSEDEVDKKDTESDNSDSEPQPPPRSFLRRMSVKVKNIVLGGDKDEKKFLVDVVDLTSDEGKIHHDRFTVDELQKAILPGTSHPIIFIIYQYVQSYE